MKSVIYSCPFVPPEWIAAHGLRPMRVFPRAVCGAAKVPLAEGLCPYAHAFVNHVCDDREVQAVIVTTVCDQMRRGSELIARHCDVPVFLMNVPSTWETPAAYTLYTDELKRLGRFLVFLAGRPPSKEKLAEVVLEYDTRRVRVRDAAPRLSGRQYAQGIVDSSGTGEWNGGEDLTEQPHGPGVAIVGGPFVYEDLVIFDLIERAGGRVVLNATESGELCVPPPLERRTVREDPLGALVGAYFGSIPHPFRRPNSELYKWLKEHFLSRDIRGVIFRYYLWCDKWHAEAQRFKEWTDLPVLELTANPHESASRLTDRIESFLEILQ